MNDDVERLVAEVLGFQTALRQTFDREVPDARVASIGANVFGGVGQGVVRGVERIDALELEQRAVRQCLASRRTCRVRAWS